MTMMKLRFVCNKIYCSGEPSSPYVNSTLYLLLFTPHLSTGVCYVDSIVPLAILIHA